MPSPSSKTRLRCSLRFAPAPGAFPTLVGWSFAWMEVTPEDLTFGTGVGDWAPFSRSKWTVQRDDIVKIERTEKGLRFFAKSQPDPWVAASMLRRRFLNRLADLGIEAPGPIRPSTWTTI